MFFNRMLIYIYNPFLSEMDLPCKLVNLGEFLVTKVDVLVKISSPAVTYV